VVRLIDHPELRRLYNAGNQLYEASSGCAREHDCLCEHLASTRKALEHLRNVKVSYPRVHDLFIQDEQGALKSDHGRGVLINVEEINRLERHLDHCTDPRLPARKETEAEILLRAISAAEAAYYAQFSAYAPLKPVGYSVGCDIPRPLGFHLEGCEGGQLRYQYTVRVSAQGQKFLAEARSAVGFDHPLLPGCKVADVWTVDQDQQLQNVVDADKKCSSRR
jgi:hypothetical protein